MEVTTPPGGRHLGIGPAIPLPKQVSVISLLIAAVAKNFGLLLIVVTLLTATVKVRRQGSAIGVAGAAYVFWGELLFYVVGIGYAYTGLLHAYAQPIAAGSIGWTPSPFEYELGWMEIPLAVVAAMSLWRGFEFRLATTIMFVVFALAAAAQHVQEILCCHNFAPGNAGWILWVGDIAVPVVVLLCALGSLPRRERAR